MKSQLNMFIDTIQEDNYTAESYTGIYGMHKYWSKKPYNIMRAFIQRYTQKGDIILDPFSGSGISVIEGIIADRKAVGIDINPCAIFISKQILKKVSTIKLYEYFKKFESEVKEKINLFYQIKRDGTCYQGTHFLWKNNVLTEVWYQNGTRKKLIDKATEDDILLSDSFAYEKIKQYYPMEKFYHNPRINAYGNQRVSDLFTPRNLTALSLLMEKIESIEDESVRDVFKFCFTSSVGQASKMVFVIRNRGRMNGMIETQKKEVGSWVIGYWMPKESFEINVWNCFENKFNKIFKAKQAQEKARYSVRETENFADLMYDNCNLMLLNQPAQIGLKNIPDNSIDYIITDPPHGNRIPYLELSMMWNSWLKKPVDYDNEIIISEAKERQKNISDYNTLLNQVFEEIQRILKPEKFFSLIFNSLDDQTWINLISKLHQLDFELIKIETLGYSSNSVVQDTRKAGLKTEFIITFGKTRNKDKSDLKILSVKSDKKIIENAISDFYSSEEVKRFETYQILNYLFRHFLYRNSFFKISDILMLLSENFEFRQNRWQKKELL